LRNPPFLKQLEHSRDEHISPYTPWVFAQNLQRVIGNFDCDGLHYRVNLRERTLGFKLPKRLRFMIAICDAASM
jgi:hypothetical protein